jgi:HlyD family secretion protein
VLRFTNFNQRTTPEIEGEVSRIGADVARRQVGPDLLPCTHCDSAVGAEQARDRAFAAGHAGRGLHPDQRADGAVLSYLMKPLADQMHRAFREK